MSIRTILLAGLGIGLAGIAAAPGAQAATYSFANSINASNNFSLTAGGVTATFSSASGPGTFTVGSTSGFYTFPVGLGDFSSFSGDPLTITFSAPVTNRVRIPFGLEDIFGTLGSDTVKATTNTGQVVTAGTTLNSLTLAEPEGALNFVPTTAFTSLTITSANPFAISSIDVPEPMSLSLLGMGLAGMAAMRRKKRVG